MSKQEEAIEQLSLFETEERSGISAVEYLLDWGKRHNYPELEFLVPRGKYQGKYGIAEILNWEESVFIPEGYEKWLHNCTNGIPEWVKSAATNVRQLEMEGKP